MGVGHSGCNPPAVTSQAELVSGTPGTTKETAAEGGRLGTCWADLPDVSKLSGVKDNTARRAAAGDVPQREAVLELIRAELPDWPSVYAARLPREPHARLLGKVAVTLTVGTGTLSSNSASRRRRPTMSSASLTAIR